MKYNFPFGRNFAVNVNIKIFLVSHIAHYTEMGNKTQWNYKKCQKMCKLNVTFICLQKAVYHDRKEGGSISCLQEDAISHYARKI